jgi:Tfp pilus assembly protein PilF
MLDIALLKEAEIGDAPAEPRPEALLKLALALDGRSSKAHYQLGNFYLEKGEAAASLSHLDKAAKLDPRSAKVHFVLSRAYRRSGRNTDAAREMKL